jgi:gas vesicle protein
MLGPTKRSTLHQVYEALVPFPWHCYSKGVTKGERRTNMEDDNKFPYFFLGLGLGVAVGLLFAPKSGAETRELILSKADEGKEYLRRRGGELNETAGEAFDRGKSAASDALDRGKSAANEAIERGKSAVLRQKEQLSAAVEAGKQAYRETVTSPAGSDGV